MIGSFLKYALRAQGPHGIHSPFVFDLVRHGLKKPLPKKLREIHRLKKELGRSKTPVTNNFGTNSGTFTGEGTLAQIAKTVSVPKKYGQLLYRLAAHFQPDFIVELGSCIGISTAYLAATDIPVLSVEGNAQFANLAKENLERLALENGTIYNTSFQEFISQELPQLPFIPFLYLDGDHSYEATLEYFHQLLPYTREESIFVLDDIYWSAGMQKAWNEIRLHPSVGISMDFFKFGVLSFKPMIQKQHFYLWY